MSSVEKPPRQTLKLRVPATTTTRTPSARVVPAAPAPAPAPKRSGADWADAHKSQMQADMDELAARVKPR